MILYPKKTDKKIFNDLVTQCKMMNIQFIDQLPTDIDADYGFVVDAIFGFSFSGIFKIRHINLSLNSFNRLF